MGIERQNVVLTYPISKNRKWVLLRYCKNPLDSSYHKFNGFLSYPEKHRSIPETARSVLPDEVQDASLAFKGIVHWSDFDEYQWPLFGHFFLSFTTIEEEEILKNLVPFENEEYIHQWVEIEKLLTKKMPIWLGDQSIFPILFDFDLQNTFHGVMIYGQFSHEPICWRVEHL